MRHRLEGRISGTAPGGYRPSVLGAGDDWAPWVTMDGNGVIKGLAVDHMELINSKLGNDIRIEAGRWPEIVAKAESGAIDGLTLTAVAEVGGGLEVPFKADAPKAERVRFQAAYLFGSGARGCTVGLGIQY
jgi:ABC-type amino acid transport substrate-binding protein